MQKKIDTIYVKPFISETLASINSDHFNIDFEISGGPFQPVASSNFALWNSLPIAMALGKNLHIDGSISQLSMNQAKALVDIWSKWAPDIFKYIEISATSTETTYYQPARISELMLYSGGLDSTYALLKHYINTRTPVSLLTIHGMDYRTQDADRFDRLKKKIAPLTTQVDGEHYFIRSNATEVMSTFGIDGGIGHGFHLFACLFIFEGIYRNGAIAADCSPILDFVISPWGTNHLTNKLFQSESYSVKTLDGNMDRAEKTGKLMRLPEKEHALSAISFCKNRQSRPDNCGLCSKCIRTKAMFYTETGSIPDIFTDRAFAPSMLGTIDMTRRGERALVLDLLSSARRNGKLGEFMWLHDRTQQPLIKPRSYYKKILDSLKINLRR